MAQRVLQHRLAEALGDPAGTLTAHGQRIDRFAEIIADDVAHQLDDAGFWIDLDLPMWQPLGNVWVPIGATSAASSKVAG